MPATLLDRARPSCSSTLATRSSGRTHRGRRCIDGSSPTTGSRSTPTAPGGAGADVRQPRSPTMRGSLRGQRGGLLPAAQGVRYPGARALGAGRTARCLLPVAGGRLRRARGVVGVRGRARALQAMQDAGLRLAVISNWGWAGPELLHTLELARHFEALVISDRVGYLKPSAGIFRHALGCMGVDAGRPRSMWGTRCPPMSRAPARRHPAGAHRARRARGHGGRRWTAGPRSSQLPDVPRIADLWQLVDLLGLDRPVATAQALTRLDGRRPRASLAAVHRPPAAHRTPPQASWTRLATLCGGLPGRPLAAARGIPRDPSIPGRHPTRPGGPAGYGPSRVAPRSASHVPGGHRRPGPASCVARAAWPWLPARDGGGAGPARWRGA